jgi:hypothetical protein
VSRLRLSAAGALGLLALCFVGCHLFRSGPTDQEVVAAIRKSPPAPPTVGPTYLANIESVEVQERGRYNADGKVWPVRVRVKGGAKIKVTNVLQLGLVGNPEKQPANAVDFVEEALLAKDDLGNWRVSYSYDPGGPRWRLESRATLSGAR